MFIIFAICKHENVKLHEAQNHILMDTDRLKLSGTLSKASFNYKNDALFSRSEFMHSVHFSLQPIIITLQNIRRLVVLMKHSVFCDVRSEYV